MPTLKCVMIYSFYMSFVFVFFREGNDPLDEGKITYSSLLEQVCKCANMLKSLGQHYLQTHS